MKYMSRKAGYTWTDYKTNTNITKELNITPVLDRRQECRRNWLQHLNKMPHNRILKNYGTTGIRDQGIPLRRLLVV
jgi:hypothetical protein